MQQGAEVAAESEPVQAYLSEFLSKIGTHLLASSDIMENQIGTLLLASEMPVPISRESTVMHHTNSTFDHYSLTAGT